MTLNRPDSSVTAVSTRLFLGRAADAERLANDNPHQIRTVITLCEKGVKRRAAGVRYLHFPVRDAQPIPIALLNAILEAIYQSVAEGTVLVHCHAGLSRAPTLVAAFLDQTGSTRFEDAIRFIAKMRPEIEMIMNAFSGCSQSPTGTNSTDGHEEGIAAHGNSRALSAFACIAHRFH
jgi:Dual specificity phosphatase, catalytic domain